MDDQRHQVARGERPRSELSVAVTVVLVAGGFVVLTFVAACTAVLGAAAAGGTRSPAAVDPSVKEPRQTPAPPPQAAFPVAPPTAVEREAATHSDAQRRRAVAELRRDLRRLVARGRAMQHLRTRCDANDLDACSECGDTMRQLQSEARDLRDRAEQMDEPRLAGAAGSAILCVSCSGGSLESCPWVEESLRDWDGSQ